MMVENNHLKLLEFDLALRMLIWISFQQTYARSIRYSIQRDINIHLPYKSMSKAVSEFGKYWGGSELRYKANQKKEAKVV
jgi:hypothetical protein